MIFNGHVLCARHRAGSFILTTTGEVRPHAGPLALWGEATRIVLSLLRKPLCKGSGWKAGPVPSLERRPALLPDHGSAGCCYTRSFQGAEKGEREACSLQRTLLSLPDRRDLRSKGLRVEMANTDCKHEKWKEAGRGERTEQGCLK